MYDMCKSAESVSYPYVLELFHRWVSSPCDCSDSAEAVDTWLFPGDQEELVSYRRNDSELHPMMCVYGVEMAA